MGKPVRFKEASFETLLKELDTGWIEEALQMTGTATVRKRRLPAESIIWIVLGMVIYRDLTIPEVVAKLGLALPGERGLDGRAERDSASATPTGGGTAGMAVRPDGAEVGNRERGQAAVAWLGAVRNRWDHAPGAGLACQPRALR